MYRLRTLLAALLFTLLGTLSTVQAARPDISKLDIPHYAPDRILVKFKPGTAADEIAGEHMAAEARLLRTLPEIGVQVLQVPQGSVEAGLAIYNRNPNVLYAEPDYYRLLVVPNEEPGPVILTDAGNYFEDQWYLNNLAQDHVAVVQTIFGPVLTTTQGTLDADIDAPDAWDLETGRVAVPSSYDTPKIAILDSGADCTSLELSGKCLEKVSFTPSSSGPFSLDPCPNSDPNYPTCDNLGHGTFTAGEAVANTDNAEGVAGVGWNTGAGIFKVCYPELVMDEYGNLFVVGLCPVSGSADAILLAATDQFSGSTLIRSKYHVISMSYGSDLIDGSGNITPTDASTAECEAIEFARDNGVLVVAAAGNNNSADRVYPAACTDSEGRSTVVSVAASNHNDDRAIFSTFSYPGAHWVSIAAPGQDILGIQPDAFCSLTPGSDTCVDWWSGTSMSAPLVAGGAALVWSDLYDRLPAGSPTSAYDPAQCVYMGTACNEVVRARLEQNADKTGANNQDLQQWTEHGRLNLYAALLNDYVPPDGGGSGDPPAAQFTAAFHYECSLLHCDFDASASGSNPAVALAYHWSSTDGSLSGSSVTLAHDFPSAGSHTVTLLVDSPDATGSATIAVDLNLQSNRKKPLKGDVSSADSGGDTGGGGTCTHPRGKC